MSQVLYTMIQFFTTPWLILRTMSIPPFLESSQVLHYKTIGREMPIIPGGKLRGKLERKDWQIFLFDLELLGGSSHDLYTWLITMVSKSPKWGYSPYKGPKFGL